VVRAPLLRQRESRAGGTAAPPRDEGAAATPAFTVDRLIVEDGTLVMSNARDRVEMRVDRIGLTASLTADEGRLEAHAYAGDQPVRLKASAKSPVAGVEGSNVPVDFSFEAPGLLEGTLTGASDVRFAGSILRINGLTGKIGDSKLNGWASLDFSSKLLVKGDFDVQRLELMAAPAVSSAASGPGGGARPPASQPWSTRQVRLAGLNYVDADVQFSAAEFKVGTFRFAPIAAQLTLADGLLRAALSRSGLYGGQVEGTASVDVSGGAPMHAFRIDLTGARALELLSDVAGFEAFDGRLQAKFDVRASGESESTVMSSLSGSVDARIQDGQILGINVPKMIRTLTAKTLTGWQESRTESTDLSDLSASFRLEDGRATTSNLRLLGPLVRVNGSGTIDLAARTLQFKLDPKLVASLEGQGGAADPLGFGVPVNVEGSWDDPRIYPDVAGILSDPDGAYAKLNALGQGLFGKGQGGLDTLMQGLGTILGPRNESRDDRRPPTGAKPSDRPDANGTLGNFLRDLFSR
jgi:AsmA protein